MYIYIYIYIYIYKIHVYVQFLFDVILNFIKHFNFLEIFIDFDGVNLSEKCMNVSCCIVLQLTGILTELPGNRNFFPVAGINSGQTGIMAGLQY